MAKTLRPRHEPEEGREVFDDCCGMILKDRKVRQPPPEPNPEELSSVERSY